MVWVIVGGIVLAADGVFLAVCVVIGIGKGPI